MMTKKKDNFFALSQQISMSDQVIAVDAVLNTHYIDVFHKYFDYNADKKQIIDVVEVAKQQVQVTIHDNELFMIKEMIS